MGIIGGPWMLMLCLSYIFTYYGQEGWYSRSCFFIRKYIKISKKYHLLTTKYIQKKIDKKNIILGPNLRTKLKYFKFQNEALSK